ncbi:MAG: aminotransferase class I/II-fold pyridoxal phosphate-dependent enzyme [Oscillospiraceae bacterium]
MCWIPCRRRSLHGYTPALGFYAVRQAMAEQLTKSFRTPYRAEDIFMTSGACAALAIICAALIGPGEEAVTLTPVFCRSRRRGSGGRTARRGRRLTPRCSRSTLRRWRRRSRRGWHRAAN